MRSITFFAYPLALLLSVSAFANDQQKAQKEIVKVTAIARDFTGRTIVNLSMSQTFNVPRNTLVQERRDSGLNYGSLLVAHELIKNGATMQDITAQLKAGKKIGDIANERHADWKAVAEDAKKFNGLVDNNLYKYFMMQDVVKPAAMQSAPKAEEYDVHYDGVKADGDDVTQKDIDDAGLRFVTWKNQALKDKGHNQGLDLQHERIGYADHTSGGPSSGGSGQASGTGNVTGGVNVPGFGGPP